MVGHFVVVLVHCYQIAGYSPIIVAMLFHNWIYGLSEYHPMIVAMLFHNWIYGLLFSRQRFY